jgi:hypothetical protein
MPIAIYVSLDSGSIVFSAPDNITPAIELNFTRDTFTIDSVLRIVNMKNAAGFGGWVKINIL